MENKEGEIFMKKLIATLLAIVMLAALSVCAFAANNFTQSPTKPDAPKVTISGDDIVVASDVTISPTEQAAIDDVIAGLSITSGMPGCIELKATAYRDRARLDTRNHGGKNAESILVEAKQKIEEALSVQSLVPTASLPAGSMVNEVLDLSLFRNGNEIINLPPKAIINIKLDLSIDNFVALLHYKETTHQWEKVVDATLVNGTLSFPVDSLSPFAIVVKDTSSGPSSPATGASAPIACAVGAVVFGVAGAALLKKSKEN